MRERERNPTCAAVTYYLTEDEDPLSICNHQLSNGLSSQMSISTCSDFNLQQACAVGQALGVGLVSASRMSWGSEWWEFSGCKGSFEKIIIIIYYLLLTKLISRYFLIITNAWRLPIYLHLFCG